MCIYIYIYREDKFIAQSLRITHTCTSSLRHENFEVFSSR